MEKLCASKIFVKMAGGKRHTPHPPKLNNLNFFEMPVISV